MSSYVFHATSAARLTERGEAINVSAMRRWIGQHRPDALPLFEQIVDGHHALDPEASATFALMAMGFSAGCQHQRDNPTYTT